MAANNNNNNKNNNNKKFVEHCEIHNNNSKTIEIESLDIKIKDNKKSKFIETISIGVFGMKYESCVGMVEHSIKCVEGIIEYVKEIQESIEFEILGIEIKIIQQSKPGSFHLKSLNYKEKQQCKLNGNNNPSLPNNMNPLSPVQQQSTQSYSVSNSIRSQSSSSSS
ncbi:hypothetical protein ACTFIU_003133 [Dictyostelium citrinum]